MYKILFILSVFCLFIFGFSYSNTTPTDKELDYFKEIALGFEYNDDGKIHKWTKETITVKITGSPSQDNIDYVKVVLFDLMNITDYKLNFKVVDDQNRSDIEIYFGKLSTFDSRTPYYVRGNWGFFIIWCNQNENIYRSEILISTDRPNKNEIKHLIREEITQSLGLGKDSYDYKNSMFYQGWTDISQFSEIDRKLIQMLYLDKVKSGMNEEEINGLFD